MLVPSRRRLRIEMWIVLGLSLGQSAVYSVVQLLDKMTRAPLAEGTSTLNRSQSSREYFDLTYQLLDIIFALVPVVLVIYFLTEHRPSGLAGSSGRGVSAFQKLGFNFARPGRDLLQGLRPGGADRHPVAGPLRRRPGAGHHDGDHPQRAGRLLVDRSGAGPLRDAARDRGGGDRGGLSPGPASGSSAGAMPLAIFASAMLRGSYHLYQGFGPFIGNAIMGVVFAVVYTRTRRVMPLVIAHAAAGHRGVRRLQPVRQGHRPGLSRRCLARAGSPGR